MPKAYRMAGLEYGQGAVDIHELASVPKLEEAFYEVSCCTEDAMRVATVATVVFVVDERPYQAP